MFKTLELPGCFAPLAPLPGLRLDPLGALSGPQTPRPISLHLPFLIPGYGPGVKCDYVLVTNLEMSVHLLHVYIFAARF